MVQTFLTIHRNSAMPDHPTRSITALILAGGQGSRMGGTDKGLIEFAGRPLIEHVLTRIAGGVDAVLISANRNLDAYRRYGLAVIADATADFPGPLAGIARGLEQCATEWLWVVPCDAPQVDVRLLDRLAEACRERDALAAVPLENGQMHPTFALLHRNVLAALKDYLAEGRRAAHAWLMTLPATEVECGDHPEWFVNLNTPEELTACAARLKDTV